MSPLAFFFVGIFIVSPAFSAEACERASDEGNLRQLSQLIETHRETMNKTYYDHLIRTARRVETKEELMAAKLAYGQCLDQVLVTLGDTLRMPKEPARNRKWSRIYRDTARDLKGTPLEGGNLSTIEGGQPVTQADFRLLMEALTIRLVNGCQGLNPGDNPIKKKIGLETAEAAKAELHEAAHRFNELSCQPRATEESTSSESGSSAQ